MMFIRFVMISEVDLIGGGVRVLMGRESSILAILVRSDKESDAFPEEMMRDSVFATKALPWVFF